MPIKSLEDVVKNYAGSGQEYHIADAQNKIFLSAEQEYVGKAAYRISKLSKI